MDAMSEKLKLAMKAVEVFLNSDDGLILEVLGQPEKYADYDKDGKVIRWPWAKIQYGFSRIGSLPDLSDHRARKLGQLVSFVYSNKLEYDRVKARGDVLTAAMVEATKKSR